MSLILAIEPDRKQAARLTALGRGPLRKSELVVVTSASAALEILAARVPDLILTSLLLSPRDESTLVERLRQLDADGVQVQTLVIPVFAGPSYESDEESGGGFLKLLTKPRPQVQDARPDGCDPELFAGQVSEYLERARLDREARMDREAREADPIYHAPVAPAPAAPLEVSLHEFEETVEEPPEQTAYTWPTDRPEAGEANLQESLRPRALAPWQSPEPSPPEPEPSWQQQPSSEPSWEQPPSSSWQPEPDARWSSLPVDASPPEHGRWQPEQPLAWSAPENPVRDDYRARPADEVSVARSADEANVARPTDEENVRRSAAEYDGDSASEQHVAGSGGEELFAGLDEAMAGEPVVVPFDDPPQPVVSAPIWSAPHETYEPVEPYNSVDPDPVRIVQEVPPTTPADEDREALPPSEAPTFDPFPSAGHARFESRASAIESRMFERFTPATADLEAPAPDAATAFDPPAPPVDDPSTFVISTPDPQAGFEAAAPEEERPVPAAPLRAASEPFEQPAISDPPQSFVPDVYASDPTAASHADELDTHILAFRAEPDEPVEPVAALAADADVPGEQPSTRSRWTSVFEKLALKRPASEPPEDSSFRAAGDVAPLDAAEPIVDAPEPATTREEDAFASPAPPLSAVDAHAYAEADADTNVGWNAISEPSADREIAEQETNAATPPAEMPVDTSAPKRPAFLIRAFTQLFDRRQGTEPAETETGAAVDAPAVPEEIATSPSAPDRLVASAEPAIERTDALAEPASEAKPIAARRPTVPSQDAPVFFDQIEIRREPNSAPADAPSASEDIGALFDQLPDLLPAGARPAVSLTDGWDDEPEAELIAVTVTPEDESDPEIAKFMAALRGIGKAGSGAGSPENTTSRRRERRKARPPKPLVPNRRQTKTPAPQHVSSELPGTNAVAPPAPASDVPDDWADEIAEATERAPSTAHASGTTSNLPIAAPADAEASAVTSTPPAPRKPKRPVQDEWGVFDPKQAGFPALAAKLKSLSETDEPPPKPRRKPL